MTHGTNFAKINIDYILDKKSNDPSDPNYVPTIFPRQTLKGRKPSLNQIAVSASPTLLASPSAPSLPASLTLSPQTRQDTLQDHTYNSSRSTAVPTRDYKKSQTCIIKKKLVLINDHDYTCMHNNLNHKPRLEQTIYE